MDPHGVRCMDAPGACQEAAIFGVFHGKAAGAGAVQTRLTLMSAVKPFLLLRILEWYGPERVAGWVDDEPSGLPYYSLEQLRLDGGKPRNAMINSGAMLLAAKLPGENPREQEELFVEWLGALAPGAALALDRECFAAVMEVDTDPVNRALAESLEHAGHLPSAAAAYEIYFRTCCLAGTIQDVAWLGEALAAGGSPHRARVLGTMSRCGLYEASEEWFMATGLPAKSGVSGVMFGVWPDAGCVAVCSPWLDSGGNPILPQAVLTELAQEHPARPF